MSIKITASTSTRDNKDRSIANAMKRGASLRCPACGKGNLFPKYLKVANSCETCGQDLFHHRADDAPAYFTMLIVGHFVVAGVLALEIEYAPPYWVHAVIWGPLLLISSLLLLPRIKGMIVGLQWALRMHGFGAPQSSDTSDPDNLNSETSTPINSSTAS